MPQSKTSNKGARWNSWWFCFRCLYESPFMLCTTFKVSVAIQDSSKAFTRNWITMLKIHVQMFLLRSVSTLCSYCCGRLPVSMYGKVANFLEPSTFSCMLFLSHTTSLFMLIAVLFFFSRPHGSIIKIL